MKAQNFRSGFCSNPSISVPPKHSLKLPSISSICVTQSRKWTQSISTVKAWSENRLQCRNCVEKQANDVVLAEEDLEYGVKRKKFAVFVSGGGSNFKSINEACGAGLVLGDVVVLVTNKQGCGGAEYARTKGIPVILFPKAKDEPNGLSPTDLVNALRSILNIHPALLPAFGGKGYYGMKVHEAVVASGARYSGPTIHFVDEHYDTGRILAQRVVPVLANDSPKELAARVLREEHKLYVEVVAALCEERIFWREDGVPLIRDKDDPNEYI
ncbi:phosphoribosylglycinamide formyltransferase, chloroplastic isoform X2 [Tripterygium wilfordii]|uniref:phosphoribosylglycinamide formyltransferase, chloroplastic isoform X2 n=1 Tax=Tripterygium wilfordii TaxID=458696 RepID=UPI0018F82C1F|nr:phosphoribosylglycinamide formyltransferase, chloroplastic isoform X2 [Tripterygium wilfordii]